LNGELGEWKKSEKNYNPIIVMPDRMRRGGNLTKKIKKEDPRRNDDLIELSISSKTCKRAG